LDNVVTIFDYEERKVGFATIDSSDAPAASDASKSGAAAPSTGQMSAAKAKQESEIASALTTCANSIASTLAAALPSVAPPSAPPAPKAPPPDVGTFTTPYDPPGPIAQQVSYGASTTRPTAQTAVGLCGLDVGNWANIRVNASANDIAENNFEVRVHSWSDTALYEASACWFHAPSSNPSVQAGRITSAPNRSTDIKFAKPFDKPPKVIVWISALDFDKGHNWRLKTLASDITANGFKLKVETWSDTQCPFAAASWVAHAENAPGITSGSYSTDNIRPWNLPTPNTNGQVTFSQPLKKPPRVVAGLSLIDGAAGHNMRLKLPTTNVTETGFSWGINTWADSIIYSGSANYIAIEQVFINPSL
jgi:H-type lectin domain